MTPHHFFYLHTQPIAQRLPAFVGQRARVHLLRIAKFHLFPLRLPPRRTN